MLGKNILLCVTGGIAVFKAAALTSKLAQSGAHVKVIMTESACKFVAPLTFQALSRNEVYTDTFDEKHPEKIAHIDLADWADLVLVAPATANIIGKLANGIADDMVSTTILATTAPVWVAPAMNVHMYGHPAVRRNLETLGSFGYRLIEPADGHLACGYTGKGRLEEPENIVALLKDFFSGGGPKPLSGKTVLVTAGPTIEKIDPVRFLSNRSSGKMGFALAEEAANMGANVLLVTSVDNLTPPAETEIIKAESAEEMYHAVMGRYKEADIIIKSAAVADYTPVRVFDKKMKKQPGNLTLELKRTKDILKELGERPDKPFLVGFAAETDNLENYARDKMERKRADIIVANDVSREGAGFAGDTNIVTIFKRDGSKRELPLLSKHEAAREILREICREIEKGEKK
ncbi:bifunctional phosphopantothenoylcysteine decarboxylase/phosphopantothenate--cysteine ligase CoaBC [Weizmannia coagulans]|jgi:phosphopantothenoylcysteine decarboxylase/phosphopantothenate--cysteine ligase|uniref:Coenzyme A biosynthesis bifunctional protein CoaBC n=2 Tax=Heyndrickxia TaxID=2837504 RepID=A0A0C5CCW6_HEYCO|nr:MULTISPECIES: bifunctional phosphopantothenoylcysteine decarboxylase/phosphopantothenate--cysteine ligase CoaBC [Heyndrickxia]AJO23415.1 phosphopantothenoylcysteine decarboxylase [Heyndrickxia coagulans]AKN55086.1 Phosphopantothenoylcysteine decarboxylase [Heyndrickxia coagulans]APB35841.1 bifunctional 4'-phosphopantothenoylcysteine decarboxylase/phosphopantothenoylcysteine synthetase [Heyndrickxia coagulans]ATW83547.1 bifunctional phosphopantothenoylcysteine decarboxylase/phosphopantothenat